MSIYTQQDDGTLIPVQIEQTVEQLLKTREVCDISPCSKVNLEALQVVTETPMESATVTTPKSGGKV